VQCSLRSMFFIIAILIFSISGNVQADDLGQNTQGGTIVHLQEISGSSMQIGDTIDGSIISAEPPVSVWWRLLDSDEIISTGALTNELTGETEIDGLLRWNFQITPTQSSYPCSCKIVVSAIDKYGSSESVTKLLFLEDGPSPMSPIVNLDDTNEDTWISGAIDLRGSTFSHLSSNIEIGVTITISSSPKCSTDPSTLFGNRNIISELDPNLIQNGLFELSNSIDDLQDGSYDAFVFSNDLGSIDFSYQCFSFMADNTIPSPEIIGPTNLDEGTGPVQFQCSSSFDANWENGIVSYFWSLKQTTEIGPVPINSFVSETPIPYALETNSSGLYQLSLTVNDRAGNFATASSPIIVNNTPPVAKLSIGNEEYSDGETISLSKDSTILLDASKSTDTANDQPTLRYIWRVDNVPFFEGKNRELMWPDNNTNQFELTLEVIDNDHDSTIITVLIKDADSGPIIPLQFLLLFVSISFLTFAITRKTKNDASNYRIPKWPSETT